LHVLFLLSGCAALIYEVVWLHLLRLVIGASALSVGIVLASFMGGMFLGSLLFSRWVPKDENPLRVYAYLELGIGGFGLLMPLVLPAVRSLYFGLVGYGPLGIGLRAFIAAVTLLPPTALMGATLPAVSRRYSHGRQGMARLASLYSANTLGAVLGCLLSAFYLLAYFDVWVATLAAVLLNAAVFALALRKSRALDQVSETALLESAESLPRASVEPYAIYLAAALSGLTALGAQVVWTRLLTLLFGATVYAFAIILAVFLGSLGLGSALSAWLLRRGLEPARGLAFSQAALIPTLLLAAHLLANVLPYASPTGAPPIAALHALHVLRALDVILPAGVFWGMSFPFALAAAGLGRGDPARSSGRVYAANTIGAIVGALATSFVMIPRLGTQRAQQALVLIAAISAAAMFRSLMREPRSEGSFARLLGALAAWSLALGAFAAATLPGLSKVFLAHGRYLGASDPRDQYLYVSEGAASTVAVHVAPDGTRHFHVSGRVEASNNPADLRLERLLGHLSALAHEEPRTVLVVGLGAGITAGALGLHPIKRLVICEIEPRVTGAAAQFAHENYDLLHDPRVELVFDDARHYLATTRERFDIITSDPIHPWVRGNSVLFSEEYYEIVRSRLNPGGIATQWVPLYETSEAAIQIQMKTFSNAFPNGTVWNSAVTGRGYDVVLLGSAAPLHLNLARIQSRIDRAARIARSLREAKIGSVVDLLGTYATSARDMNGWLAGASVNRDFSLKLEYISGLALNETQADPINAHMIAGRHYPEGIFEAAPALQEDLKRRIP
jgi:spermidine synthase